MDNLTAWLPRLIEGWWLAVSLAFTSTIAAGIIGFVGGVTLLYGPFVLRVPVRLYVDLVRGLPLLVLLFAVFYGSAVLGFSFDVAVAVTIALSLFGGAQAAEVVRAGLGSISRQYIEAAKSLGLPRTKRMSRIVLPLALPRMIPPSLNISIELLKGTSLASLVGAHELIHVTQSAVGSTFDPITFYIAAGAIYVVTILGMSQATRLVERRMNYSEY